MFQIEGLPEEDSLVLATVTKVNPNSVFVVLDHYGKKTALIHISEISPGRIRNIRDFVVEDKKVVVKVLKVDKEKGHIDVSLRRVTDMQKRDFMDVIKQEQKAEKLLENFAEQNKIKEPQIKKLKEKISKDYDYIWDFFQDVIENEAEVSDYLEKDASKLDEFIRDKIQPEVVEIKGVLKLRSFDSDGIEKIKKILLDVIDENFKVTYLGAGAYSVSVASDDYKEAEKILKQKINKVEKYMEQNKGVFSFEKKE